MFDSLIDGINKLLASRKFLTTVVGVIVMGLSLAFNIKPELLDALKWLLLALIATWTSEDIARAIASRGELGNEIDRLYDRVQDLEEVKAKKK
jgi:phosphatidylserine synthase